MKNIANKLAATLPAGRLEELTHYLSEFMTEERFATLRGAVAMRTAYMTVLTENTFHPQNASAIVRHCDAFGIQNIHTVETLCRFNPNTNIVRGTDKWVDIRRHASTREALEALRGQGYRIVATTPHGRETTPESFDVAKGPFAIVLGTEHAGISEEVISSADEFLKIPMCGMVESLNVSASAAIILYILSERMRREVNGWRLSDEERTQTLFRWCCAAVRNSADILSRAGAIPAQAQAQAVREQE